jgi:nitrogen fixation NifU-like protein
MRAEVSPDLQELYQEVILDHYRKPRNFGKLPGANRTATGHNPLCGDAIEVQLELKDGVIHDIRFECRGCAISTASASLMTQSVKGKTPAEARAIFDRFHAMVTGESEPGGNGMSKLAAFAGVREFPVRVKCATLAWHALRAALENPGKTVSTE